MLILILIPCALSIKSDCQFRSITDCLEFNKFNLKYQCQIKNHRCIQQKTQINPPYEGFISFQKKSSRDKLESKRDKQKRRPKYIKNQIYDEDSDQFTHSSFSSSDSSSSDSYENYESDTSNFYYYPTFEDEESSLEIEFIPKNSIQQEVSSFIINPISSMKLAFQIITILISLMYF